jgi:hypothetical protein
MTLGKLIWAACALAISFGLNSQLKPTYEPVYDAAEASTEAGVLTLQRNGESHRVPLATVHVVTQRVSHLGARFVVREVWLRSVGADGADPVLEVFASIPELSDTDLIDGPRDSKVLRQLDMPLAQHGLLGKRSSYVALPGAAKSELVEGSLTFSAFMPDASGAAHAQRARGRLDMQIETDHGVEFVSGQLDVRVVWDEVASASP